MFRYFLLTTLTFFIHPLLAQNEDDCSCGNESITLCYLPDEVYCISDLDAYGCGYALDGYHMLNYLTPKLESSENFGSEGILNCPIDLNALKETITVDYIEQQQCDIIFMGNFTLDTLTFQVNTTLTSISDNILNSIRTWSLKCETNLVITTQAESRIWGYEFENINVNPNIPNPNVDNISIFDGPFGNVTTFNQGGLFQGVIVEQPATGFTVLGLDSNDSPTMGIDLLTNDIILGDIGIFCGGGAGEISEGATIQNSNDQLVCNIFALGCTIASGNAVQVNPILCFGDTYILPNGEVVNESGVYFDTLTASNLCDSIIITNLEFNDTLRTDLVYQGCQGDGYEVVVNSTTYNEFNPSGIESLISLGGCDSILRIDLKYFEDNFEQLDYNVCEGTDFEVYIGNETFNENNTSGEVTLPNINGCDSTIIVNINVIEPFSSTKFERICEGEFITINDINYQSAGVDSLFLVDQYGCDSLEIIQIELFDRPPNYQIQSPITVNITDRSYMLNIPIENNEQIIWTPQELVSCTNCSSTTLLPKEDLRQLNYEVIDTNGCSNIYTLDIDYRCPIYFPNVLIPLSNISDNAQFKPFTPCTNIENYSMKIYDRWGGIVFESNDPEEGWRGGLDVGEKVNAGVYVYLVNLTLFGNDIVESGDITVLY